jgi:hypothetical protein
MNIWEFVKKFMERYDPEDATMVVMDYQSHDLVIDGVVCVLADKRR